MGQFSTKKHWGNGQWIVVLNRGTETIATMTLDEWAALEATQLAMEKSRACTTREVPAWLLRAPPAKR